MDIIVDVSGKASGRTRSCGVAATFADPATARLWARVGARATRTTWTVTRTRTGWRAAPAIRPKIAA